MYNNNYNMLCNNKNYYVLCYVQPEKKWPPIHFNCK